MLNRHLLNGLKAFLNLSNMVVHSSHVGLTFSIFLKTQSYTRKYYFGKIESYKLQLILLFGSRTFFWMLINSTGAYKIPIFESNFGFFPPFYNSHTDILIRRQSGNSFKKVYVFREVCLFTYR